MVVRSISFISSKRRNNQNSIEVNKIKNKSFAFIGQNAEILSSSNNTLVGTKGVILDETKNSFVILVDGTKKTIIKKGTEFVINKKKFCGEKLTKRIEDRIKKNI